MESEVIRYFITQGPFAILFVWLLFSSRKEAREREQSLINESREREAKLHDILDKFSEKYDVIISEIRDIKDRLRDGE